MASWQTAPRFPAVSRGAAVDDCLREFSAGRQSVARPALPVHRWHQQSREAAMVSKRERCGDCHALEGEYHELGCDLERCPFCGGQLISCDCCYEILNIDGSPGTRVYEFGLTPKQRKQWERTLNDKAVSHLSCIQICVPSAVNFGLKCSASQIRNGSGTSKKANAIKCSANHAMIK